MTIQKVDTAKQFLSLMADNGFEVDGRNIKTGESDHALVTESKVTGMVVILVGGLGCYLNGVSFNGGRNALLFKDDQFIGHVSFCPF